MPSEQAKIEMARKEAKHNPIYQLRVCAGLCNTGEFDIATIDLPLDQRKITGDATDQALFRFSEELGEVRELQMMWKKTFELAFNSKNKFMVSDHLSFLPKPFTPVSSFCRK